MISLSALADWHGWKTADLIAEVNDLGDQALWFADPDLAVVVDDFVDIESLLDLGGCLDANHAG